MDERRSRPFAPGLGGRTGKLKVLHVVEATTAGVGCHVIGLSTHQQRLGLDVTVACPAVREAAELDIGFVDKLRAAGVPVVMVAMRRSIHLWADPSALLHLIRLIRRENYNVVHTHSSKAGGLGRLAARWARRSVAPVILYTPNAFAFMGIGRPVTRRFYLGAERCLGQRFTDLLICVSRSEMDLVRHHAITRPERQALLENVIDVSAFKPGVSAAAKAHYELDPDRPVVGYVGRLAPQKGVDTLVEAAEYVLAAEPEAQFVLAGEGDLEGVLRQRIAAVGLGSGVRLLGYQEDIPYLLTALDIFALPSRYEGLPFTLMEAMAAGLPVVATEVGGNRDLIEPGQTGLLVPPDDARALAKALSDLIAHPAQRQRLSQAALAAARARPTPENRARRVVAHYRTLIQKKRGNFA